MSSFPESGYQCGSEALAACFENMGQSSLDQAANTAEAERRWRRRHLLCLSIRSCACIITRVFLIIWEGSEWPGEEPNFILEGSKGCMNYLTGPLKSCLCFDESIM